MISHVDTSQAQGAARQDEIIKTVFQLTSKQERWYCWVQQQTMLLILCWVANMTAVPMLLFIFLTLPDSAYMSDSSLNSEPCPAAKKHDKGPTGLPARSTKSHGTLDSALKEINWEVHIIWTDNLKFHCLKLQWNVLLSAVKTRNQILNETKQFF